MWSDTLGRREYEYTKKALDALGSVQWAKPLLRRVEAAGGLCSDAMPLLFEARFASELMRAGATPEYEYCAGVGSSTVEFRIPGSPERLVELVSIRTSNAARDAIRQSGLVNEQSFSSNALDRRQSGEGEMITAQQKIGEKVFAHGKPTKFPSPGQAIHTILADMRGYLDEGGDREDYRQMAYGSQGLSEEYIHYWEGEQGKFSPIAGLYEGGNPLKAAPFIQQRIHFLGFVREHEFTEGEIQNEALYFPNPHLFSSEADAKAALETLPSGGQRTTFRCMESWPAPIRDQ